ncbi:Hypothetical protein I596_830 [Dokdonella koreensis DS-123]|uniref:Uncharacterized protein n=1 Tax=Dokdonella koreensis DS-123 TaxID=1300342 RepID=A0A167GNQ5_9GAMM|nr:Hypothetical protein I596_830 [Dokdonella koreensis DS-123]
MDSDRSIGFSPEDERDRRPSLSGRRRMDATGGAGRIP